jgi:hypothetical protein
MQLEKIRGISRETPIDREIRPPCKCFCCNDSGKVCSPYLSEFVEGKNDRPFICRRIDCEEGARYMKAYNTPDEVRKAHAAKHGGECLTQRQYQNLFDVRLTPAHCEQLHRWGLHDWLQTLKRRACDAQLLAEEVKTFVADKSTFFQKAL